MNKSFKHAIITGGSSGIGLASAQKLIKKGYNITLMARRKELLIDARESLLNNTIRDNQIVNISSVDVSNRHNICEVIEHSIVELGSPDVLITCAGIADPGYIEDLAIETYEEAININYLGTVYAVKTVLPHMKEEGGHILMVSSGAGLIGIFGYSAYSPTKFALKGFAEVLQAELKKSKISVSIAYPPDTQTAQLEHENLTKPSETKIMTETAGVWSADDVAEKMIRGMFKGKFAITPGFELSALYRLSSLINPILQNVWAWQTRHISK